tara:strand:- start:2335 stop:2664 length:330 start_codon:yes stop_codon:yes gene_type:complete
MSTERTITIEGDDLPCHTLVLEQKGRGSNKYTAWTHRGVHIYDANDEHQGYEITLTEQEVCEYSAKALEELAHAEERLRRAQVRADSLREFSRRLYAPAPQLTLEANNS